MRRSTYSAFFLILALAAGTALRGQDDGYLLRAKFEEGQVDHYKLELASEMKVSSPGAGDQDFAISGTMDYAYTFGKRDGEGRSDLEMKATNIKLEATGAAEAMMSGQEMPKEFTIVGKVDDRYRVTEAKTAGLPAQAQMTMAMGGSGSSSLLFELPEKSVKLGDTWPVAMPANPMLGDKIAPLTAKLIGIKDVDGVPCFEVEIGGNVPIDVDMSEVMKKMSEAAGGAGGGGIADLLAGMSIRVKGAIDVKNLAHYEVKSGRLAGMEMKADVKQTMTLADLGVSVDIGGSTRVKMKRVAE